MADLQSLADAVQRLHRACRPRFARDPAGEADRVSSHQGRILAFLDGDEPAMVGELAEHLGVTASTMSVTLQRMEGAGLVRRDRDPLDRRVTNVRLTAAGVRARDARREVDPDRLDRLLALLPPDQRPDAVRALLALGRAADRLEGRERETLEAQL